MKVVRYQDVFGNVIAPKRSKVPDAVKKALDAKPGRTSGGQEDAVEATVPAEDFSGEQEKIVRKRQK